MYSKSYTSKIYNILKYNKLTKLYRSKNPESSLYIGSQGTRNYKYFDIKIEYVDITEEEFNSRMAEHQRKLKQMFDESHKLEREILEQMRMLCIRK